MNKTTRILVFSAMCIALASITSMIKVFEFPTGGSITLASTLFAVLPGYFFGPAVGIVSGFAYGILQFFLGAFAAFGLSGFFASKKYGLHIGYLAACVGRWFFAFLSGWIFFGEYAWEGWNAAAYSAVYNIIYIAGEAVVVLILISIPAVADALNRVKAMGNN